MALVGQIRGFIGEVQVEMSRVSWPTRNELRDSTAVVIVTVLLVAVFVGVVDQVLTLLVGLLFR